MAGADGSGFEWDEDKRFSNIAKHGIDFLDARRLFDGRPVLEKPSPYEQEQRFVTIGHLDERYITVVWTQRRNNVRIISARRSRRQEVRAYLAGQNLTPGDRSQTQQSSNPPKADLEGQHS